MKFYKTTILFLLFTLLNTAIYGQNKTPIIQNISKYIVIDKDTVKIQRLSPEEREKLFQIGLNSNPSSQDLLLSVLDIQEYLKSKSIGKQPLNSDSLDILFLKLNKYANEYRVYFNLENYKKEAAYYVNHPRVNDRSKNIDDIFREIDLQNEIRNKNWVIKKRNDSISTLQKTINDSIEIIKQKQEYKRQIAVSVKQKKHEIKSDKKYKLDTENKKSKRKESIINKYGLVNGEAILNHKVKIGWSKSMCISSWGKPRTINRTTTLYGIHEQYVYSMKKYLYFENNILTTIQD